MKNKSKKQVETIDSSNDKLLLSDVIKSVCVRHSYDVKHKDLIPVKICKKCGHVK